MLRNTPGRAAILWTGGKDSALAMELVRETGLDVAALVTLAPPRAVFRAHPLPVLVAQAAALGIPHRVIAIDEPYDASYRRAFQSLIAEGFTHLVTGDIDRIAAMPNWVRQCAQGLEVEVLTPLWCRDREELLAEIRRRGLRVVVSCVRPPVPASLCGRALDEAAISILREVGADLCGENGEYHTLVLDGPGFARPLLLDASPVTGTDGLTTLSVREITCDSRSRGP